MILTTLALAALPALPARAGGNLEWFESGFANALGKAAAEERPIFLYFWADSSGQCAKTYQESISSELAAPELESMILFSANTQTPEGRKLVERYHVGTLPTMIVIGSGGEPEDAILGYIPAESLVHELQRIKRGENTVGTLRGKVAEAPDDLDLCFALAVKLRDIGDREAWERHCSAIKEADPKGRTTVSARLRLWDAQKAAWGEDGEERAEPRDLAPVARYLERVPHAEVCFEGWTWIAAAERHQERHAESRKASMAAFEHVPEDGLPDFANEVAWSFWEQREELTRGEKKFALQAMEKAAAKLEEWRAKELAGPYQECRDDGTMVERELTDEEREHKSADWDRHQARYLDTLACCYYMGGKRRDALKTIERCIAMDPEREEYAVRLASFKERTP